mmetsp:Transcript_23142/g.53190  ORF Transcript_23142/g.53190 Transcript_23142/m.53190 type:complete len:213 (+) Transcript_23142:8124-8762(+)
MKVPELHSLRESTTHALHWDVGLWWKYSPVSHHTESMESRVAARVGIPSRHFVVGATPNNLHTVCIGILASVCGALYPDGKSILRGCTTKVECAILSEEARSANLRCEEMKDTYLLQKLWEPITSTVIGAIAGGNGVRLKCPIICVQVIPSNRQRKTLQVWLIWRDVWSSQVTSPSGAAKKGGRFSLARLRGHRNHFPIIGLIGAVRCAPRA